MIKSALACLIFAGNGVLASQFVSRIVVPLPKLMKFSEATAACEAEGLQLARFKADEAIDYATATLVEKNLDRVWIGGMGADERNQLALEVFEGLPIVFKVEQVFDEEKMLAVLCEPVGESAGAISEASVTAGEAADATVDVTISADSTVDVASIEEPLTELNLCQIEEQSNESSSEDENANINNVPAEVICTFKVDLADNSVQITDTQEDENGVDLIKSKGEGRRDGCSRSYRRSRRSKSSSESCGRHRRHYGRCKGYRKHRGGYRRKSKCSSSSSSCSSSSSSCSSSSSSTCASSFSCDPFCPTGSSSSSESRCHRKSKRHHKKRSNRRPFGRNLRSISSSRSSSSSSSEDCGSGRCGGVLRSSKKFFREIRLSQRIH